jgi:hypothetical protein
MAIRKKGVEIREDLGSQREERGLQGGMWSIKKGV